MDLSIIIVNYRGWKRLMDCLDELVFFSGEHFQSEVIIVDNNSGDGIIEEFRQQYPDFNFIVNEVNGGFAHGCNLGSRHAKGDYFLFLNPDTVASEAEVEKLFERAKANPGYFISSCRQVNESGRESRAFGIFPGPGTFTGFERAIFKVLRKKVFLQKTEAKDNLLKPDWISGSVVMIKRDIFNLLGGFDEDFWMYYEDTDLCKRARDLHGEVAYFTDITIQHNHGGSSRINLRTTSLTKTEVLISRHIYVSKHFSRSYGFILQMYLVINNIITGSITAVAALLLFFKPKMLVRLHIFIRLTGYYLMALRRRSFIASRSVNFNKNG